MPNSYLRKGGAKAREDFSAQREEAEVRAQAQAVEPYREFRRLMAEHQTKTPSQTIEVKGLNLSERIFTLSYGRYERVRFVECDLSNAQFHRSMVGFCEFVRCNLSGAEFIQSDLYKVQFVDTNLVGASFKGCFMEKSSFKNSDVAWAQFCFNYMGDDADEKASFKDAQNIEAAHFGDVDFKGRRWAWYTGSRAKKEETQAKYQGGSRLPKRSGA